MAMMTCPDCRQSISKRAYHCPYCGRPIGELLSYRTKLVIALVFVVVAVVAAVIKYQNAPH